jgi:hypothetical protein
MLLCGLVVDSLLVLDPLLTLLFRWGVSEKFWIESIISYYIVMDRQC